MMKIQMQKEVGNRTETMQKSQKGFMCCKGLKNCQYHGEVELR